MIKSFVLDGIKPVTVTLTAETAPEMAITGKVSESAARELRIMTRAALLQSGVQGTFRVDVVCDIDASRVPTMAVVAAALQAAYKISPAPIFVAAGCDMSARSVQLRGVFQALRSTDCDTAVVSHLDAQQSAYALGMTGGPSNLRVLAVRDVADLINGQGFRVYPQRWAPAPAADLPPIQWATDNAASVAVDRVVRFEYEHATFEGMILARRIHAALPPLTEEQAVHLTAIYSAVGMLPSDGVMRERPFRAPHHTVSEAGMAGTKHRPTGELSLAQYGVLVLDRIEDFHPGVVERINATLRTSHVDARPAIVIATSLAANAKWAERFRATSVTRPPVVSPSELFQRV